MQFKMSLLLDAIQQASDIEMWYDIIEFSAVLPDGELRRPVEI